ncbi:MAG: hypothetical protein ACI9OE_002471 [Mariniflexile sp.]|jgi:hypothetical protein
MFLILSGAYIGAELESEFGKIPPSFLPLGNRRLFEHQIDSAPNGVIVYITIPESYKVSVHDLELLEKRYVKIIKVVDGLTLGESIVAALNLSRESLDEPLHLLFGDTLIPELPIGDDIVGASKVSDSYNWSVLSKDNIFEDSNNQLQSGESKVVNGYFCFSDVKEIIRSITQNRWQFIPGLNTYKKIVGLSIIDVENWFDFGHVNTYYHSKTKFTTQRAFNDLLITSESVQKSSSNQLKIKAEAHWYSALPYELRGFVPQYLGDTTSKGKYSYKLEYLHNTALNELFVFSELPPLVWQGIINCCLDFIDKCKLQKIDNYSNHSSKELFTLKTNNRLAEYSSISEFNPNKNWVFNGSSPISINKIIEIIEPDLPTNLDTKNVIHGDFCCSNILFDFRANKIKVIDPRGLTNSNEISIYGNSIYDMGKLSHSIIGMYDWIIAGYFTVEINEDKIDFKLSGLEKHKRTQNYFLEKISSKYAISFKELYAVQIHLFLSMLPLHNDSPLRQKAFLANAFRLYNILLDSKI